MKCKKITLKIRFHYNSCCDKIFYGVVLSTLRVMNGVPHGVIIKNLFTVAVANSTVAIFGNAWHVSDRSEFLFKLGSWFKPLYCVSLGQDSLIIINVLSAKDSLQWAMFEAKWIEKYSSF